MKDIVTAWQMKGEGVFNDHADAAYDASVLARLGELHADVEAWLAPLVAGLPRLARYGERLGAAAAAAAAGDGKYIASPRVDSYHGVWFELHEDLILLAGRNRTDEVAAGPRMSLDGRRIVVTGASAGLGAHTVRLLAGRGAQVLAVGRRLERLEALAAELADAPGRVVPCRADVTSEADADRLVAAAVEALGGIDVLVNNAGSEVQGGLDVLAVADLEGMLRSNVVSVFLVTRAALPELRRSGGMVVNLGSTVVARPPHGRFGYVASKAAVEAMTRALAADLGRDGIRVNCIRPGIIPSELRGSTEDEERARFETGHALRPPGPVRGGAGERHRRGRRLAGRRRRALGHRRGHRRGRRADPGRSATPSDAGSPTLGCGAAGRRAAATG